MKFCLVSKMLEYLTLSMWANGSLGQVALSSLKNYGLFLEDNEVTVIIATFPISLTYLLSYSTNLLQEVYMPINIL